MTVKIGGARHEIHSRHLKVHADATYRTGEHCIMRVDGDHRLPPFHDGVWQMFKNPNPRNSGIQKGGQDADSCAMHKDSLMVREDFNIGAVHRHQNSAGVN